LILQLKIQFDHEISRHNSWESLRYIVLRLVN
jgi:hypothetical protein